MQIRSLSAELQKKAENELNETPNRLEEDLQHIREWLLKQPHLKTRTDDQWLLNFLRGCKFSLQRTKEKLDYYHMIKGLVPEFFENRDPLLPEIQEILKAGVFVPLPKTADPASPRLVLCRWGICDPNRMLYVNLVKAYLVCMNVLMLEDDNCMVAGVCILVELKGFSPHYLLQCTPTVLKKSLLCMEHAYPVRTKKVDFLSTPSAFEVLFNLMKPLLSDKLKNRINLYTGDDYGNVKDNFPDSVLPKEYGGSNESLDDIIVNWKTKVESYRDWFLEDSKYRTYEELRLGKPVTTGDVFGVEGSFRKLTVD